MKPRPCRSTTSRVPSIVGPRSGRTSLVKVVAVCVDPRSVWKITPSIAERPYVRGRHLDRVTGELGVWCSDFGHASRRRPHRSSTAVREPLRTRSETA